MRRVYAYGLLGVAVVQLAVDLGADEIVVRRSAEGTQALADRLAVLDDILARGRPHPAGTTDAWLAHDREH